MNISSTITSASQAGGPSALNSVRPSSQQHALLQAASTVNAAQILGPDNEITFRVDPKAKEVVVRIVNSKTGELVSQIPEEYLLKMAEEVSER
jgi:uncharacterized FlaG/YvyC family protein